MHFVKLDRTKIILIKVGSMPSSGISRTLNYEHRSMISDHAVQRAREVELGLG